MDLSSYIMNVSLPIDERNKFYGEVAYENKEVHAIEDFFESPTMIEIQNKIKSDLSGFKSKKKNITPQKELNVNTSVEVFYPKLKGFINAKSFAKVRLVITTILNFYGDLKQVMLLDENSIIAFGKVFNSKTGEGLTATIVLNRTPRILLFLPLMEHIN